MEIQVSKLLKRLLLLSFYHKLASAFIHLAISVSPKLSLRMKRFWMN